MVVDDLLYDDGYLEQNCVAHSNEPVRFYCKDDMSPLCAVCVTEHAAHDFVVADYRAAMFVKQKLIDLLSNLDFKTLEYRIVAR